MAIVIDNDNIIIALLLTENVYIHSNVYVKCPMYMLYLYYTSFIDYKYRPHVF